MKSNGSVKGAVALRKESVDRNELSLLHSAVLKKSLSARRAWIEINVPEDDEAESGGRSPQGERG